MKRTLVKIASVGMLVGIVMALLVACADSLRRAPECIQVVPALVPVPLHIGRLQDGGAVIVGFQKMLVIATAATIEYSMNEDIEKMGLTREGQCSVELPVSKTRQEYQIFSKEIGKVE